MASLGDHFSEEQRKQYVSRSFKESSVVRGLISFNDGTTKEKICIVLGSSKKDNKVGFVMINTNNHPINSSNVELKNRQIPIDASSNEFLDYDSFIDSAKIQERDLDNFQEYLKENPGKIVGEINPQLFKTIKDNLRTSPAISPAIKARYNLT